MKPQVSVIIPTYNSSHYIAESIGSVLAQGYPDFEIIVVDDGSTDNTAEIVKKFYDPRIIYIKTPHQGNYFARNRGIQEAHGKYIAFLDVDDIWLEDKLKSQVEFLNRHEEIGLCCTDHYIFFNGDKKNLYIDTLHQFSENLLLRSNFLEKLLLENIIITSSIMVRKSCFEHLGVFDTAYQNAMDYEMWLRIALNYKMYYLKNRYVLKRRHVSNIGKNKINTAKSLLYIFNKVNAYAPSAKFFAENHRQLIRKKIQKTMYDLGLEYLAVKKYPEAFQFLRNSRYAEKNPFRYIGILTAKLRIGFLVPLINFYRSQRQRSALIFQPANK